MSKVKFGRDEMKQFIRDFEEASWDSQKGEYRLLNECGCEDAEASVYDDLADLTASNEEVIMGDPLLPETFLPLQSELSATAPCPDSYNAAADYLVHVPHELVEMLQPLMQQLGIGCPASLAQAMGDVLTTSQDLGVTDVMNTDPMDQVELALDPAGEVEVTTPLEISQIDLAIEEALRRFRK